MFGWPEYEAVHARMLELLDMEDPFAAVYANGYLPSDPDGAWRKPNPGMFLQAAKDLNIGCARSIMVGDKLVDLQAATRAGVGALAHVLTGHGPEERAHVADRYPHAALIDTLADLDLSRLPIAQGAAGHSCSPRLLGPEKANPARESC
jgi:histidinol phosphatase-like enzyme